MHVRRHRSCRRSTSKTEEPATTESPNTTEYYADQKKALQFNVQDFATANYRLISVSIDCPGSTNDFFAFTRSKASEFTRRLPASFFLVGDAVYPLDERLLTLYPGRGFGKNTMCSASTSVNSARLFRRASVLSSRRGESRGNPLKLAFAGRAGVVNATFCLHNFLRDEGVHAVSVSEGYQSRGSAAPQVD